MKRSQMLMCCYAVMLLLVAILPLCIRAQENKCRPAGEKLDTCQKCIQNNQAECTWCAQEDYLLRFTPLERCDLMENHIQQNCTKIVNPTSTVKETKDDNLTKTTKVKPQQVTIRLRPGQTRSFNISVRTPKNYPVDMYMVMDMSYSMKDNLAAVEKLGIELGEKMETITSRFRVGFGTMVDKPVLPFGEAKEEHLQKRGETIPPWAFRNALPLTENTTLFAASVTSSNLSETYDGPDVWPDTLMQVAVCENYVGWFPKNEARRLVVISTEDDFHIAGDGLLGGIVTPNDGRCKLESSKDTYKGTTMDYPSLPHLRQVLSENSIVPIFAISPASLPLYESLIDYFGVEIGARAGAVQKKSTNIVNLIRQTYEEIGKTQTVYHNAEDTKDIKVEYSAYCLEGSYNDRQTCSNVSIGKTVTFKVSITLEKCPDDGAGSVQFNISTALGDVVPINVEYLCDCDCSQETVDNSSKCSINGRFECGKCYCNTGYTGLNCDCDERDKEKNKEQCRASNTTGVVCSDSGECVCGKCVCESKGDERVDGKFCECNSFRCSKDENGIPCGEPDRGECGCNECICKPGWSGDSCSCTNETRTCIQNNVLCSNRGSCVCGKCECERPYAGRYTGDFCEGCDGCKNGCQFYQDCVRCRMFRTGDCEKTCNASIASVEDIEPYLSKGYISCQGLDDNDDCTFTFGLKEEDGAQAEIVASEEKTCPREEGYLLIIIGVILGIVAIGAALLLIWKLLATIQDRREFAKFEREQQNARWDTSENPIFKQATTTFQNPTYGGKS